MPTITLNSRTAPVNRSGHYICQSKRIPRVSNPYHCFPTNSLGTTIVKEKVISLFHNGECISKQLILEKKSSLDLLDDNCNPIKPLNVKGSPWLQYFDMSNLLYARATRSIINHTPIGEYRPRFFPREDFLCPYSMYSIETRRHILYEYSRFNKYWNPRRNTIAHFTLFLQLNSNAFSF